MPTTDYADEHGLIGYLKQLPHRNEAFKLIVTDRPLVILSAAKNPSILQRAQYLLIECCI